jgi:hypothetical protein
MCEDWKGSNLAQYNYLKSRLELLEKEMLDKEVSAWLIPKCPKCDGILSLYTFTQKLVCLKCGSVWALGWCLKEKPSIENAKNDT